MSEQGWGASLKSYFTLRMLAVLLLGYSSGVPLALTASTLFVWLTEEGVDKAQIGLFAAIATPYAFKFAWSPLMDSLRLPLLCRLFGRRRGWLLGMQAGLIGSIALMGMISPGQEPWLMALAAVMVATFSASQDIVIDALRVEMLEPREQGHGAAVIVLGYRIGMITSGAGALFIAEYSNWHIAYGVMAACIGIGVVTTLLIREPGQKDSAPTRYRSFQQWLAQAVVAPFRDFTTRPSWLLLLLFVVLYKFGDAFMGVMTNPFLIELGFRKDQIAAIVKLYGLVATLTGSVIGAMMVHRLGTLRALWIGGLLQMLSNLSFMWQAQAGADEGVLTLVITLENLCGGIGTAAFVAYLGSLCNVQFTATQYALLSSLASAGRTWMSTGSGWAAKTLGWEQFFLLSTLLCLPGLAVLWWYRRKNPTPVVETGKPAFAIDD